MSYKQIPRNRPIATLIEWYSDKKSGKVTDARKEIQKRFDYLDWDVQKRIVLTFLQSGLTDRRWAFEWACSEIRMLGRETGRRWLKLI